MRIRNKISFMARKRRQTISELLISQVYASYNTLTKQLEIPKNKYDEYIDKEDMFEQFLSCGSSSIFRFVMHVNAQCSCNSEDKKRLAKQSLLDAASAPKPGVTSVIRNGTAKVAPIGAADNEQKSQYIQAMLNKDNAFDIFSDLQNYQKKGGMQV
jgi:hypothetical protein